MVKFESRQQTLRIGAWACFDYLQSAIGFGVVLEQVDACASIVIVNAYTPRPLKRAHRLPLVASHWH
jgi:hypothetical protein